MKRVTNADKVEIIRKLKRRPVSEAHGKPLQKAPDDLHEGQKVALVIGEETEIGFKAIINNNSEGILYRNEVFQPLVKGQKIEGFIKKIRDDKKIDLCLYKPGYKKVDALSERIIERLNAQGGFISVTDKSTPEAISELFGVSKKAYKMIIGRLYKNRLIVIEDDGIRLIKQAHPPFMKAPARQAPQGVRRKAKNITHKTLY